MADVAGSAAPQPRHRVRTAIGVGSLAVLVVMTLLWVRSYQTCDRVHVSGCYGQWLTVTSYRGGAAVRIDDMRSPHDRIKVNWGADSAYWMFVPYPGSIPEEFLGIAWRTDRFYGWQARLPYWLVMLVAGIVFTLAFPNWPRAIRSRSFSLRTLFIATTVAALLLGLLIALPTSGNKVLYATPEPTYDGDPALPILPLLN